MQGLNNGSTIMSIYLLIVDDHDMVREGLKYAFADTEIEIVEAADGETALRLVADREIDIVLLDVEMPVLDGLQVLTRIKQQHPNLPVVMHSCHDRLAFVKRSMELGAAGYLLKSPDKNRVIEAMRVALAGGNVVDAGSTATFDGARRGPVRFGGSRERSLSRSSMLAELMAIASHRQTRRL